MDCPYTHVKLTGDSDWLQVCMWMVIVSILSLSLSLELLKSRLLPEAKLIENTNEKMSWLLVEGEVVLIKKKKFDC